MALAKSQRSLRAWTKQDWGTKSGKPSGETGERYLPKAAREALSPQEYAATTAKKREDTAKGKQFSKQPEKTARKVRQFRRIGKQEGGDLNLFDYQAATPEEILQAGGTRNIVEPTTPTPIRDYIKYDVLNPSGRQLFDFTKQELQNPLNYLGVSPPARAAVKVAEKTKDLVFVHNTSEEAIKSFDKMGGLPSPSIAVTKADQPFTGFGNIQLIGKPEKFDPAVNPANKVYSADAYTPRAPQKIRLAKKGAAEKFLKDYKAFDETGIDVVETTANRIKDLENKSIGSSVVDKSEYLDEYVFNEINAPKFVKQKFLKETGKQPNDKYPTKEFRQWLAKEKDKYFGQDGVFLYWDEIDQTTKTMPYTLDNVVDNMVRETQRGGEGGLDTFGANRLRAVMAEQFKDLPDIRTRKKMLIEKPPFYAIEDDIAEHLGKISDEAMDYSEDVMDKVGARLIDGDSLDEAVYKTFQRDLPEDISDSPVIGSVMQDIANTFRLNSMRPVQYFEAKPTRAVGFNEFAGAIVPENTSKEVIDILKKRGLKVVKQKFDDINTDYGKGKIRQQFKDQYGMT